MEQRLHGEKMKITTEQLLKNFINDIRNEYIKAREVIKKDSDGLHISRGRSRSISAIAEDLFATLIAKCIGNNLYYFVDQPITYKNGAERAKTVYPDLMICRKCEGVYQILYMLDLKIDIGWSRNDFDAKIKSLNCIKENICKVKTLKGKDGINKNKTFEFSASNSPEYAVVIITVQNSSKKYADLLRKSESDEENIWVLSSGNHPNDYCNYKTPICRYDDFNRLINKIKDDIK